MSLKPIRIAITGPESSGKSSLSVALANHFQVNYVDEYARFFLSRNGKAYTYDQLVEMAKKQIEWELKAMSFASLHPTKNRLLFFDTDLYVFKIWSELAFGKCESFILDHLSDDAYDLHLLCKPDLPWQADELREHPDANSRNLLYLHYQGALMHQPKPCFEIHGSGINRTNLAIEKISSFL
jgi:nicotinamide riboside kinase